MKLQHTEQGLLLLVKGDNLFIEGQGHHLQGNDSAARKSYLSAFECYNQVRLADSSPDSYLRLSVVYNALYDITADKDMSLLYLSECNRYLSMSDELLRLAADRYIVEQKVIEQEKPIVPAINLPKKLPIILIIKPPSNISEEHNITTKQMPVEIRQEMQFEEITFLENPNLSWDLV